MNRREVLGAAIGGASLAYAAGTAFAAQDHAGHPVQMGLTEAARQCVSAGGACLSHCIGALAKGDASLGECAKSAYQMSAVCEAVARLSAEKSDYLPGLAKVAYATCIECEKDCRKHANEQAACKACAEACAACAEECKKHMA